MKWSKSRNRKSSRNPSTVSAGNASLFRFAIASSVSGWIVASRWTCSSIFGYGVTSARGRDPGGPRPRRPTSAPRGRGGRRRGLPRVRPGREQLFDRGSEALHVVAGHDATGAELAYRFGE